MITCGLMIIPAGKGEPAPVPLTGVSVKVRIVDLVAEVNIEQRYVNRENQPIEAIYKFPLEEGAAVCNFTAEVDGRSIQGVVKETEEVKTDYEEAIRNGHTAFLVEDKLPDIFKARVGNLGPGSGAKIRITYVTELKVEGGKIRFFLPTTIAPRYVIPALDTSSVALHSEYKIEFEASVKMGSAIKDIRSPTHKITSTKNGTNGVVKLDEIVTSMDRDLVLNIEVIEPYKARLIAKKSNGSAALMLSLVPSFKLEEQKAELIFVVDRSGSMQGTGIEQAKKALLLFLHALPVDCYVNILGFGSTHHFLFPVSRKCSDQVLKLIKEHIESLDANLGGAEIFAPLEALLEQRTVDGYQRHIFILTGGEVSNKPDRVISLIRMQSGKTRFHALGLGSSASHQMVEGIARAGNGTALFASTEEGLEMKVRQQLQAALQPSLTNVKVTWDGVSEENKLRQAPCDGMIPPVLDGRHLVVYALLQEGACVPRFVKLAADSPSGPLSVQIPLNNPSDSEEGLLLHRMAAKKLIQLLQNRQDDHENCKKEIIKLGCTYGLASRYTSYVAVDPKAQSEHKESWIMMESRDLPVQIARAIAPEAGMMMKRRLKCLDSTDAPVAKRTAMRPDWVEASGAGDLNLVRELIYRHSNKESHLKLVLWLFEEAKASDLEKECFNLNEIQAQIAKGMVIDLITSILTDVQYVALERFIRLHFFPSDEEEIGQIKEELTKHFRVAMEKYPFLGFACYLYANDGDEFFIECVKTSLRDERVNKVLDYFVCKYPANDGPL